MRRQLLFSTIGLTIALTMAAGLCLPVRVAFAQEKKEAPTESEKSGKGHGEEEGGMEIWKWANFLMLAGGLGYLIGKHAGPFFAARTAGIRKDMEESLAQRQDAETRAADVERRLANMESDIAALRGEGERDARTEAERMERHTAALLVKIQEQSEQEIASAGKAARTELKRYAAGLAVDLAEQKVRARMTPDAQDALVQGFVRNLK